MQTATTPTTLPTPQSAQAARQQAKWAARLLRRYGIATPMAPADGTDEEDQPNEVPA